MQEMASPPRVSVPSALDEAETRFDRPLMLSWEEQRKVISLRDSPKKFPIPPSPMSMKARMSAFAATSISSPPFVKRPPFIKQPKKAILAPPLADFPSSEDALAETTVLVADEISAGDASTTSHTVPITLEDDSFGEDKSSRDSSGENLVMERTFNNGDSWACLSFDDDDSDTDSHYSQLADSFELPEVYQEDDTCEKNEETEKAGAGKCEKGRFDCDSDDSDSDDAAGTNPKKDKKWKTFEKEQSRKKKGKPRKCKKGRFDSDSDDSDSDDAADTKPKKEKKWKTFEKEQSHHKNEGEEEKKNYRFDRPLTLSWEEQEKLISLRDSPNKCPIPPSPMSMKARMSAFEVKQALSTPPLARESPTSSYSSAKKTSKGNKTRIPPPPLVDSSTSGDALAETTVFPALVIDETFVVDASMTSHAAPTTNEDDCYSEDAFVSTSVISHSTNDAALVEETCNVGGAGKTVQVIYHDDDSDTDSRDSQLAESLELPEVYQEDDTPETRFDRPLTLSWEEQRKLISRRDSPKKYPIPASPMNMKSRMSAFEMKQALSAPPLTRKGSIL
jgi:hypothetical protein